MAIFENFPYTNFHEMNLDYLLKRVRDMEAEIEEFKTILESGPVLDVKANVGGSWVSQKDAVGNVNLPAGNHSTIGGLKYESTADTEEPFIALNNGGGWEKVPALDANDKIDPSLYDAPVQDVMTFDTVEGDWVSILNDGVAEIPAATQTLAGAVMYATGSDLLAPYGHLTVGGGDDYLPVLDANKQVDASVIPDTAVTAGTYGTDGLPTQSTKYAAYGIAVGSDGRITAIYENTEPIMRVDTYTIAAGSVLGYVYLNLSNNTGPWYNNGTWINVNCYEITTDGKGNPQLKALVHGTDYTYNITQSSSLTGVNVSLTTTHSVPVVMIVNGSYGRSSK